MSLNPDPEACLQPTEFIDAESDVVQEHLAKLELDGLSQPERAIRIFEYIRDTLQYEFGVRATPEEYRSSYVLEDGKGFCVRKAIALCGLGRAAGIPTALVLCDMRDRSLPPHAIEAIGTDMMYHHGLNAFHLGGEWLKVDATLSPKVVSRKNYRPLIFDGKTECLQQSTTLDGQPHAEYITFHGLYADVPFEQMIEAYLRDYNNTNPEKMRAMGMSEKNIVDRKT